MDEFERLRMEALASDADQEDINRLGEWFERECDARYWDGESWIVDAHHYLEPIYEDNEDGMSVITRYKLYYNEWPLEM